MVGELDFSVFDSPIFTGAYRPRQIASLGNPEAHICYKGNCKVVPFADIAYASRHRQCCALIARFCTTRL